MKTIIFWTDFENLTQFAIVEGDYRHLDETIINCTDDEKHDRELMDIVSEGSLSDEIPYKELRDPNNFIIRAGFAP